MLYYRNNEDWWFKDKFIESDDWYNIAREAINMEPENSLPAKGFWILKFIESGDWYNIATEVVNMEPENSLPAKGFWILKFIDNVLSIRFK